MLMSIPSSSIIPARRSGCHAGGFIARPSAQPTRWLSKMFSFRHSRAFADGCCVSRRPTGEEGDGLSIDTPALQPSPVLLHAHCPFPKRGFDVFQPQVDGLKNVPVHVHISDIGHRSPSRKNPHPPSASRSSCLWSRTTSAREPPATRAPPSASSCP